MTSPDRIGVEIGGTFTDLVMAAPDGTLTTGKTPSTPPAPQEAVLRVLDEAGADLAAAARLTHGSTVATNALLTRRGAKAGLLTTAGFRDVAIMGRADRDHDIFDMRFRHPAPPIRRAMIAEVPERISADGEILVPLDLEAGWEAARRLIEAGAEGLAICFLHAWRNPAHEQALAALIRERAPAIALSVSHEVSPEFREYERTLTTTVNAFVGPVVEGYVRRLDEGLKARGRKGVLQIMQSNGGAMPAAMAGANAVRMLLSGPAAGMRAAMWFAERNGLRDVITLDMGGTSTDVALAPDLTPAVTPEMKIDGLPVRVAALDMATIGAGGGSIVSVDPGGFLAVGPDSAGADPGPACYGRGGTRPTVTDAQVIAGVLRPARFFGGRMALRDDLARQALAELEMGPADAAADMALGIVNGAMAGAVRLVSTARGIDPQGFALVAYGGGGPLHAASVAEELGMTRVLVPWSPGLASAFGLLIADITLDAAQSELGPLGETTLDADRVAALVARARRMAEEGGLDPDACEVELGVDLRYAGQAFELTVRTPPAPMGAAALREAFEGLHRRRYGYARADLSVESTGWRITVRRPSTGEVRPPLPSGEGPAAETRTATIAGRRLDTTFLAREALAPGAEIEGPAVLEEPSSTTLVPPGWRARCLPTGDLLLERTA
ncbi:hydantoinase/oxoprolinase family protein [Albimonas sp. CAU 1670]|uniref:hydantoinase/oxoprolinase family protein n=1 Tax=Albimonas sp. CAU 1670 TaxID=3032599 RepID=UPI0023D9EA12|nr:hydantoinase/oxoprolinase family protein [Albimonas sp. CAU 1670]MDF2231307.1 hydantoinase/oxoprolinase family protein [Albimonas sp. CAU 1670]